MSPVKRFLFLLCAAALLPGSTAWAQQPPQKTLCQPWWQAYEGEDATGKHVLGLWNFNTGAEMRDAAGKGHDLTLKGAVVTPEGRFGQGLESFCGYPVVEKCHAVIAKNSPALTPKAAFSLELWLKPKPELADYPESFLIDKKYVADTDYQFTLSNADKGGKRSLVMRLGFGEDSETFVSDSETYALGEWHHVAFTYDGAGTGRFYRDGKPLGGVTRHGRGSIAAGKHPLSIGDRIGSYYHGFPGIISQVRLCDGVLEFRPVKLEHVSDRDVFVRMESVPPLQFRLSNLRPDPIQGGRVVVAADGKEWASTELPEITSGAEHILLVPVDTTLKPGEYQIKASVEVFGQAPYKTEETFLFTIVPRHPARMPVVMWGLYGADRFTKELARLKDIGFTHSLGFGADQNLVFEAGKPVAPGSVEQVEKVKRMLNLALANDIGIIASLAPGRGIGNYKNEFLRVNREGKVNKAKPETCAAYPELAELCYNVGASVAQTYGDFPAWQAALMHTEVRDGANICWHEHDRAACRAATGADYPEGVLNKRGVEYAKLKDFPADRVVPDDHPLLKFLSWYWKEGDGWNRLNTELHRGLKSTGRNDIWTFHDPAVRVASVYGSGGAADIISQWTYSYPDPIRIGLATDELFAMARGASEPQQVMKMTQIIWYRSQTAPAAKGDEVAKAAQTPWEDSDADAAYPTIAPMHLREAFWTKLARPVRGIMYHGWGALVPDSGETAYRYTHPETKNELRRLIKKVVEPLGPTLLQVPDRNSDVAFLESFASQMFARRGTYGWGNGWSAHAYHVLLWAGLQPEIIYDETVLCEGLEGYRILFLMDCDVLTKGVVNKILAFQKNGGLVVADERLCPAVSADIVIASYERTREADKDRAALIAKAQELREALKGRYVWRVDSSSRDVVPRCRTYGTTDYLFAVNDLREFGNYVGHHGLVMENGRPTETVLTVRRAGGHVYDLVEGRELKAVSDKGVLKIARGFGPCEGGVMMITDKAIKGVSIEVPDTAQLDARLACRIRIVDDAGTPLDAVVPVRVEISDPSGAVMEWSGYYGAKDGTLDVQLDIAKNDAPGIWQIKACELASGQHATKYFRVVTAGSGK
ncbi:MAG: LamG-like jellyroll fold domain-containing protein [Kiritimatiellia bacterium]